MAAAKMSISKMDAVRMAIKQLGKDAMPMKIQEYIKARFGLEITTAHVSNYKTEILRAKKGKKAAAAKA
jgi:actin-like ATPase involved in cell morphogenesis